MWISLIWVVFALGAVYRKFRLVRKARRSLWATQYLGLPPDHPDRQEAQIDLRTLSLGLAGHLVFLLAGLVSLFGQADVIPDGFRVAVILLLLVGEGLHWLRSELLDRYRSAQPHNHRRKKNGS